VNAVEKHTFNQELMSLAVPFALQNLLHALVGATDALMLGRLNQESIAAVSLANQISFIMSLFTGAIIGAAGVLIAQYWGKRDYTGAKRFMSIAIRNVFFITLVFFLLAFLIPEKLMFIFTKESELIEIGAEYLKIVSFSYVLAGVAQCYLMMMRVCGRQKLSVWIAAVTVIVDMVVDFFLIYGFGGIPALGANGAAYSTIAVEVIALTWCLIDSYRKDHIHPDRESMFFFSKIFEVDILKIAASMLASSLSWGLSISVQSLIMGHLGTDATAAASVTGVALQLMQCVGHGLSGGAGIMIGRLLGQNFLDKAKQYGRQFWTVSTWCGILNVGILCVIGPLVLKFYVLEPLAKSYLVQMLIFSAFYMFAFSYNAIITCGVFPAGGDAKYDAISVFFATWCFALPLALLGCFVFRWPVMAVYIIMRLDEIVKVPFIYPRYKKYIWVKNLTREQTAAVSAGL